MEVFIAFIIALVVIGVAINCKASTLISFAIVLGVLFLSFK